MRNIFFLILIFITGNIYGQSWNPITGKTSFTDSVRYLKYKGVNNLDSVLMIHPTTGVLIKGVKGLTPSVGVDSITLYYNQLCQWSGGIPTCYFLQPSTFGANDSLHLNFDSTWILHYSNGTLLSDSIYLIHTVLYTDNHFALSPYLAPYTQLLEATRLVDSVYASPFGTSFNYIKYATGHIDSLAAGGGGSSSGLDSTYISSDSLYQIFIYASGRIDSVQWVGDGSAGGGDGVDSIWRTLGQDSIKFSINGRLRSIKDSTGGGGSQDLQSVTDIGNITTNQIISRAGFTAVSGGGYNIVGITDTSTTSINAGNIYLIKNSTTGFDDRGALGWVDFGARYLFLTVDSISPAGTGQSKILLPVGDGRLVTSVNGTAPNINGDVTISTGGGSSLANFYLKDSSLSSNRIVNLNGKTFSMYDAPSTTNYFYLDPVNYTGRFAIDDAAGGSAVLTLDGNSSGTNAFNLSASGAKITNITGDAVTGIMGFGADSYYFYGYLLSSSILTLKATGVINISNAAGYQDFISNAAAISGGLVAGDVYRTGDFLKVVH